MSGGSYNYIYNKLQTECDGYMYDDEMNDLVHDLVEVLHDVEWWQSADISEKEYRNTVTKFKKKWLIGDRNQRLKGYIDKQIGIMRNQLYDLIGVTETEKDKVDIETR